MGLGLSAFPNDGEVAEAVKYLISQKSISPGFIGTGFFKKTRTEFRYDIYQVKSLDDFLLQKREKDQELQPFRDMKNTKYTEQGMQIINELMTYNSFDEIPKIFTDNLLDPSKDYYQQILNKIKNSH